MMDDFTRLTLKGTKSQSKGGNRFYEDSIFGQCCIETELSRDTRQERAVD